MQVLKHIANKEGGAHYDKKITPIVDCLSRQSRGNGKITMNGIHIFLLDISTLLLWLGNRLILSWKFRKNGIDETKEKRILDLDQQFENMPV